MGQEFVEIFTGMGVVSIVLIAFGLALLFTEIFIPGFGVTGILGSICLVVAVVFRAIDGGSFFQIVMLIAMLGVFVGLIILIMVRSASRGGIISKTPIIQSGTAVPTDYAQIPKHILDLIGQTGVTVTVCHPIGRAKFGNTVYDVKAANGYIIKGADIVVTEVTLEDIIVSKTSLEMPQEKGDK